MRVLSSLRDPYGLGTAAVAALVLLVLQQGPWVATGVALAVVAVRVGAEVAARRFIPRDGAPALSGNWYDPLTYREAQVAALIAEEHYLQYKEIGDRLGITERGVQSHVEHIRDKLDLHSRQEIAAWVRQRRARQASTAKQTV